MSCTLTRTQSCDFFAPAHYDAAAVVDWRLGTALRDGSKVRGEASYFEDTTTRMRAWR